MKSAYKIMRAGIKVNFNPKQQDLINFGEGIVGFLCDLCVLCVRKNLTAPSVNRDCLCGDTQHKHFAVF